MNASELKYQIESHGHEPYFFSRKTMKFFGDTMRNYGVCSAKIQNYQGETIEVWELYRKHPVKNGFRSSAYFDKVNYNRVFSAK